MSEENKATVRRLIEEVWTKGNLSLVDELIAAKAVLYDPQSPPVHGTEGFKQYVSMYRSAFPDLHFTIDDLIAEGEKVVCRWTGSGTQTGDLPDIPATGKQSTVTGITISSLSEGKFVESYVNWDTLGMLQNLDVVPRAEQEAVTV